MTGALSYAKTFTYDAVGNRKTQVTTGTGAASDAYVYDTRDRLTSETVPAATYTYDANGNTLTKSNEATYTWDLENRLTKAAVENGTVVQHTYDADGNRVKTVAPQAPGATACSGSSAMFVKADTTTQGNWEGTYGADGDYINAETAEPPAYGGVTFTGTSSFTWAASTTDVRALEQPPPQTSRIASTYFSATTETFHVTTTDNEAHTVAFYLLDWDNVGRAESVTAKTTSGTVLDGARPFSGFSGGVYAVYTICGSVDFTVTRTAGANAVVSGVFFGTAGAATATNYLVDVAGGLSQVVAESDASGSLTAQYVRNGDELLAVMRPGGTGGMWTTRFVHSDGLGSVRVLTDESGTTTDTRGYEAFGTRYTSAGSDSLAYGFAGEPLDATTHLAYHRARWMDSRTGRFMNADPSRGLLSEDSHAPHMYAYVDNSPANAIDPTGYVTLTEGREVHDYIGDRFKADGVPITHRRLSDKSFLNWLEGATSMRRPDLVDRTSKEIFEIKTFRTKANGVKQLNDYLAETAQFDTGWRAGTGPWNPAMNEGYSPPTSFGLSDGNLAVVMFPINGLILYDVIDRSQKGPPRLFLPPIIGVPEAANDAASAAEEQAVLEAESAELGGIVENIEEVEVLANHAIETGVQLGTIQLESQTEAASELAQFGGGF